MSVLAPILISKMIKYERLSEILYPYGDVTGEVNLFIDVRSIVGPLFTERFKDLGEVLDRDEGPLLCSQLVNLCGHYRNYFWTRQGAKTNVIMFYSNQVSDRCLKLEPTYKADFRDSRNPEGEYSATSIYVNTNLDLLKSISERIPYVYLLDTGQMDPVALPYMILSERPFTGHPSLLLSNNKVYMQYIGLGLDCHILTLKGDHSRVVTKLDVFNYLTDGKHDGGPLGVSMILPALSIAGTANKTGLRGWSRFGLLKAVKYLEKLANERVIVQGTPYDAASFCKELEKLTIKEPGRISKLRREWEAIDATRNLEDAGPALAEAIRNQIVNKEDTDSLYAANHRHFSENPMKLSHLFGGEERTYRRRKA